MTTMTVPNTKPFVGLLDWLSVVAKNKSFGFLRTPEGDDFVVARPEQIAELDAILSDPAFVAAVEAGVSEAVQGRVTRVEPGLTLKDVAEGSLPCDASLAANAEKGVQDAIEGKVTRLQSGQSLKEFL